jgi:hypothetical protein
MSDSDDDGTATTHPLTRTLGDTVAFPERAMRFISSEEEAAGSFLYGKGSLKPGGRQSIRNFGSDMHKSIRDHATGKAICTRN